MARIKDIIKIMERLAPSCTQDDYDNSGFQIGDGEREVFRILTALEVSHRVIDIAVKEKVQLIITHHPLIFRPFKQITDTTYEGKLAMRLIEEGIALYSAHTPLDACAGGVNDRLCELLGIREPWGIYPQSVFNGCTVFAGRVGYINAVGPDELAGIVGEKLNAPYVRISRVEKAKVEKIAVCGGAGSELSDEVIRSGADAFITGELKYHDMLKLKAAGIVSIEAGHYHTEYPVISVIIGHLQNELNELQYKVDVLDSGFNDPYGLENY